MESDLKRVARLEYLKLRQSKQSEKVDAVKVLYRIQIEFKTYYNLNIERSFSISGKYYSFAVHILKLIIH